MAQQPKNPGIPQNDGQQLFLDHLKNMQPRDADGPVALSVVMAQLCIVFKSLCALSMTGPPSQDELSRCFIQWIVTAA